MLFRSYIVNRDKTDEQLLGSLMFHHGDTDALIVGFSKNYSSVLRPVLKIIGKEKGVEKIASILMDEEFAVVRAADRRTRLLQPGGLGRVGAGLLLVQPVRLIGVHPIWNREACRPRYHSPLGLQPAPSSHPPPPRKT